MKLVIDCVLKNLDLAILDNQNKIICTTRTEQNKNLSEILIVEIENILKISSIQKDDINDIYVINGPGSFTSLKLVSVFANIWKYEKKINLFTMDTCLWNSLHENSIMWFDAKSKKVFYLIVNGKTNNKVKICSKKWFEKKIQILKEVYEIDQEKDMNAKIISKINFFKKVNKININYVKKAI